jgi:hypothetical protein
MLVLFSSFLLLSLTQTPLMPLSFTFFLNDIVYRSRLSLLSIFFPIVVFLFSFIFIIFLHTFHLLEYLQIDFFLIIIYSCVCILFAFEIAHYNLFSPIVFPLPYISFFCLLIISSYLHSVMSCLYLIYNVLH